MAQIKNGAFTDSNVMNFAEQTILIFLPTKYRWICRDDLDNELYIFEVKPEKRGCVWTTKRPYPKSVAGYHSNDRSLRLPYKNLFKWIKWTDPEPVNIDKALNEIMSSSTVCSPVEHRRGKVGMQIQYGVKN